jgi:hypothetical protein
VAEALASEGDEVTAVLFYGATLLMISSVFTVLARYVMTRDELIGEGFTREDLRPLLVRIAPSPVYYGLVLLLALVAPQVAAWGFLVGSVSAVLLPSRTRAPRRRREA